MAKFRGLLVVVPTRNRAELAGAAVDSILALGRADVRLLVSDNSTDEAEIDRLAQHCAERSVERVRPPTPLAMPDHWEWAMERALDRRTNSHVTFQTDRQVVFPAQMSGLVAVLESFPGHVISYPIDVLNDLERPYRLSQRIWTGRVLRLPSSLLIKFSADSRLWLMSPILPRLLNCAVPREIVARVRDRFGTICGSSIAPDYAFAFRSLTVTPAILHYDRPPMVSYALYRSNGASAVYGRINRDHADFIANFDGRGANFASPIPGLVTALNTVIHEYNVVRADNPSWPEVDWELYLSGLRQEAVLMDEGPTRTAVEHAVVSHAARPVLVSSHNPAVESRTSSHVTRASASRAKKLLRSAAQQLRMRLAGQARREVDVGQLAPVVTTWQTPEEALTHARESPLSARSGISRFEMEALEAMRDAQIQRVATVTGR